MRTAEMQHLVLFRLCCLNKTANTIRGRSLGYPAADESVVPLSLKGQRLRQSSKKR